MRSPRHSHASRLGLLLVGALGIAAACSGGDSSSATSVSPTAAATTEPSTTVADTTTTEATTTTTEAPKPKWPLTGLVADDPSLLTRPAVIVKVGNYDRHPQRGTNSADIVVEEIINDNIPRFAMVFHSTATKQVGPIRSGRLQDVNLFTSYNRPVFAWSGGNATVVKEIRASELYDLSQSKCQGTCYRGTDDKAPYNLFFNVEKVFALTLEGVGTPPPQFTFRSSTDPLLGVPSPGVDLNMEAYEIEWNWDASTGLYQRRQNGSSDKDWNGDLVTTHNVVILAMDYKNGVSGSPDAQSIGTGEAFIFTGGNYIHGTWSRDDNHQPFTLVDDSGAPILLTPGRTFVELPRRDKTVPKV